MKRLLRRPALEMPRLEMPQLGLPAFRLRILVRGVLLLLAVATVALSVVLLKEEKERAWQSYQHGFERSQSEVMARLRHPAGQLALLNAHLQGQAATPLAPLLLALALGAAGYSAFLFAQAEGRDFWQSPLVLPHLLTSALTAGAATALLAQGPSPFWRGLLLMGLGAHFLLVLAEAAIRRRKAVANPWGEGATTLEWTLPSPPPFHQFNTPPVIKADDHH